MHFQAGFGSTWEVGSGIPGQPGLRSIFETSPTYMKPHFKKGNMRLER